MSVTVDSQPLAADKLGLSTIGQVLSHLQKENRLVVQILIDGQEPDLDHISALRSKLIAGHTLFIETTDPRQIAREVIDEMEHQLVDADRLKAEVVDHLTQNNLPKAMEQLGGCFRIWQAAQESVQKTAQLLRLDLSRLHLDGDSAEQRLGAFSENLRSIRNALESRDFVSLGDVLNYEMENTAVQWNQILGAIRSEIAATV